MTFQDFKFELNKKNIDLNTKTIKLKTIKLKTMNFKLKGIYKSKNLKFEAKINIKFCNKENKISIKKINIVKLDIENSFDEYSNTNYCNLYYNINIPNICSSSSSSSGCFTNDYSTCIYNEIILFINNIKLSIKNDEYTKLFFSLKHINIKKMKIKGIFNL
jgi:hypothetical protein